MNFGSCLLVVLALGAFSASSVLAAHRSHSVHYASSHHPSRGGPRSVETSRTSTVTPRDSSSETKGSVADRSKGSAKDGSRLTGIDKGNGDDESLHARQSGKTGVAAPSSGVSGKESADAPIDTRITVNQGHETIKGFGKRQFRNSNVNVAAGGKRQHVADRHQGTLTQPLGDRRRNSIGAIVERGKDVEHRNAVGIAVIPTTTTGSEPKVNSTPSATGTTIRVPNVSVGNAPINNSSPVATQANRGSAAGVTVTTTNGPSINGTGMIRPASRIAAIGGPAKVAPGVLSGNSFRPKHP